MSKFDANYVEPMEYDFTGIRGQGKGRPYCTGKGYVTEPTKGDLEAYQEKVQRIFREALRQAPTVENPSIEETRAMMEQADNDEGARLLEELYEITVDICDGSPSKDELDELPARYQQGFCIWLAQELTSPKYQTGDSNRQAANGVGSTTLSGGTSISGQPR